MRLTDQLHCPFCKSRLTADSADVLRCSGCERSIPVTDGIADFVGASPPMPPHADRYHGDPAGFQTTATDLLVRIRAAVGERWPGSLGDVIEFGCGRGHNAEAIVTGQSFRSLLVLDTDNAMLQACQARVAASDVVSPALDLGGAASSRAGCSQPVAYATLSGAQDCIRDAVADTVIGTALLAGIGDVRAFLAMVHRVLRPGGRAAFLVPNRRYYEAMCLSVAEALVQSHARNGAWPEGHYVPLELLAQTRRLLVHRGDVGFLANLETKHLFDSDLLQDLGEEVGFAAAELIPLDPDPVGAETMRRICQHAGAPASFTDTFGALAAAVGRPFFNLLGRQDSSATTLLWLTKATGPGVRVFSHRPGPPGGQIGVDVALGGAAPRWSVELLARDTPAGIVVSVGGWCLCNSDVKWVRLTLGETVRHAPVWRPRPDVHEVLNRRGLYQPLNTLCSGLAGELVFEGVHVEGGARPFRLEIVLASGVVVSGPAPDSLVMDETVVVAH